MTSYLERCQKQKPLYRKASTTLVTRNLSKLTSRTSWYKGWGRDKTAPETLRETSGEPTQKGTRRKTKRPMPGAKKGKLEVASVMFIPRTNNGAL